jgi:hypothetical protein
MNVRYSIVGVCLAALCVSGCAKYRPKPLAMPSHIVTQEKEGVALQAALLDNVESKQIFGERSPQAKGYQTIQLALTNKTNQAYELDAHNIGLELASAQVVAHQIGFNTAGRVAGWGIAGLFIWPFLIPAIVDGVKSSQANRDLERDLDVRTISNGSKIYIQPHSTMNKVMFVASENYRTSFDVDLINQHTGDPVNFSIKLA